MNTDDVKCRLRLLQTGRAQRSVLGSLMFLLYTNDLSNISPDDLFILFIDDTTSLTATD